ncbi:MAG: fimbrillin family protein [Candidatus Cryptobacteroides sp.]|nr:fimbrillin family protein [Bacteroidales bacterium]MDY2773855.1 fimbrillin family protein [Candidatus Cryptobacteroides sp.]
MNRYYWTILASLSLMAASCGKTEPESATALPEGKYPLKLTAEMTQPLTRSGGKDAWAGGEEIGVNMDGLLSPRKFVIEPGGSAKPIDAANAIWWKNADEARVTAWYPDIVNPALDISDQSGGYADFDLVWATAVGRYDRDIVLQFTHRMAKIEFSLAAGDGITEEELASASVKVLGDDEAYFSIGMIGAADKSDGEIAPYYDSATKKFEAVVVPQDMTGKPLIRIGLGGKTFAYTPETQSKGKLDAGTCHSYAITVKANGLEVETPWGYDWSDGGEENVTPKQVQLFKADELKIGDYFYSDGTWSDGGLRKRYEDGSMVTADPKPAPEEGKTVVGIVFQTDPSRIGAKEKKKLGAVHGLVMSVKNAAIDQKWGPVSQNEGLPKCYTKAENYKDISGYGNCEHIRSNRGNFDNYPAFKAADDYNKVCPVPETTTGWYLPASGQWWDILQNLGRCPALADPLQQSATDDQYHWYGQGNVSVVLNTWMEKIAADSKDDFFNDVFWSSSEYKDTAWYWYVGYYSNDCSLAHFLKSDNIDVRPVLAF